VAIIAVLSSWLYRDVLDISETRQAPLGALPRANYTAPHHVCCIAHQTSHTDVYLRVFLACAVCIIVIT